MDDANLPPGDDERLDEQLDAVAALKDPLRRALYRFVARSGREVSRDEAASAAGVQRALAAFHLDKLVGAGLLEATYRRLSGRTGPGAGRSAKLYRRSRRQLGVSLPPRDYELAARLFAATLEGQDALPVRARLDRVAGELGAAIGRQARAAAGPAAGRERLLDAAMIALGRHGFEPWREGDLVYLRNCPFHALAQEHRELVCGMNLSIMEGLLAGLQAGRVSARLTPSPDRCCVLLHASGPP